MNDRFRFRVWDKNYNKWVDPDEYFIGLDGALYKVGTEWPEDGDSYDYTFQAIADNYIVQQCTGLKDKNGKLIYEGDIVLSEWENKHLAVAWDHYNIVFVIGAYPHLTDSNSGRCEIIGNIFENKELLKKE